MKRAMTIGAAACLLGALSACNANYHSIFRRTELERNNAEILTIDAKQRAILTTPPQYQALAGGGEGAVLQRARFCAEPSPDVFSVVAQALGAGGTFGQGADPASVEAALNLAFSSAEQGSTIPRTQTVNMLRDLMYRTCERYLSGGYSDLQLSVQAIRDQRLMVSILAIEQLTGAVTPKPVVIGASGNGAAGATGEAIVLLDAARKARDQAALAYDAAVEAYGVANGADKVCDAIAGKPEAEVAEAQKPKIKPCDDARKARTDAEEARSRTADAYEELRTLARSGGVSAGTRLSHDAPGGLDAADPQAVSDVSATVQAIVLANLSDSSEVMLFCLQVLRPTEGGIGSLTAGDSADLRNTCVNYLNRTVEAAEARLTSAVVESRQSVTYATTRNFDLFWSRRGAAFAQQPARTAFVNALRERLGRADVSKAACFDDADTRPEALVCFRALSLSAQERALAIN